MGSNWTETLRRRRTGAAPGFGVPRNIDKLDKGEVEELAEVRGIDTTGATKKDLVAAIQGR